MSGLQKISYIALTGQGERTRGVLDAPNIKAARDRLIRDGLTPLRLDERANLALPRSRLAVGPLSDRAAGDFAADLARLLGAGIALVPALVSISSMSRHTRVKSLASSAAKALEAGGAFSGALRESGEGSQRLLAALVTVGEQTGALAQTLTDAASTLRAQASLRSRILGLLLYPALVVLLTTVVLAIFLLVVAPSLRPIFDGYEGSLPLSASILFSVSDWLAAVAAPLLISTMLLAVLAVLTPLGRSVSVRISESLALSPIALGSPKTAAFAAYSRAIALALRRGVRLAQAHTLASEAVWSARLRASLRRDAALLDSGEQLSSVLLRVADCPAVLLQLCQAGEVSGRLAEALSEAAEILSDDARTQAERLVAFAGPGITLLIGGLVALVVTTIFQALASIAEVAI